MFKLERKKTNTTPYILIDEARGYMQFLGESFHENVPEFYAEVVEWMQGYLRADTGALTFDCELRYFNSSTAKLLLNLLLMMDAAGAAGKQMRINWITTADNEINLECGEDFAEDAKHLEFNIVVHPI